MLGRMNIIVLNFLAHSLLTKAGVPREKPEPSAEKNKIELDFNLHQIIQISRNSSGKAVETQSASLEEYTQLIENMRSEITDIRNPPVESIHTRQSLGVQKRKSLLVPSAEPSLEENEEDEDDWSSASDIEQSSPGYASQATKSISRTPPSEAPPPREESEEEAIEEEKQVEEEEVTLVAEDTIIAERALSPSPLPPLQAQTPPRRLSPPPKPQRLDTESDLADQILNSMSAASPSPKKPRHTLSLAERTRLSMSRTSHSQISELHDEYNIQDLPRLSIKPRPSLAPPIVEEESDLHAGLIERTRKSMAGFEAAQKKAQLARRRSVKDAKKKARESTYFPKVEEETITPDLSAIELIEGDPDYESVFKSRPKIKTSPAVSPTREIDEDFE